MTVYDLTKDQLEELKTAYFYDDKTRNSLPENIIYPWQIPDDTVFKYFEGFAFVNDDFSCSCGA